MSGVAVFFNCCICTKRKIKFCKISRSDICCHLLGHMVKLKGKQYVYGRNADSARKGGVL